MTRDEVLEKFNEINIEKDIKKKEEKMLNIIKKSNFILEENLLIQFDDENWYKEENYLKKFLAYKIRDKWYKKTDCDVSLAAMTCYKLIYPYLSNIQISQQPKNKYMYEFIIKNMKYKGDTLTSAITVLKKYLGFLYEKKKNKKEYEDFERVFSKLLDAKKYGIKDWKKYVYDNADVIWNAMDKEAKEFIKNYMKLGNYICIPGNTYKCRTFDKYVSFNMARSNFR